MPSNEEIQTKPEPRPQQQEQPAQPRTPEPTLPSPLRDVETREGERPRETYGP